MDLRGDISRNLRQPPKKDTVMVPDAGYTIIRFKADNPGIQLRISIFLTPLITNWMVPPVVTLMFILSHW